MTCHQRSGVEEMEGVDQSPALVKWGRGWWSRWKLWGLIIKDPLTLALIRWFGFVCDWQSWRSYDDFGFVRFLFLRSSTPLFMPCGCKVPQLENSHEALIQFHDSPGASEAFWKFQIDFLINAWNAKDQPDEVKQCNECCALICLVLESIINCIPVFVTNNLVLLDIVLESWGIYQFTP